MRKSTTYPKSHESPRHNHNLFSHHNFRSLPPRLQCIRGQSSGNRRRSGSDKWNGIVVRFLEGLHFSNYEHRFRCESLSESVWKVLFPFSAFSKTPRLKRFLEVSAFARSLLYLVVLLFLPAPDLERMAEGCWRRYNRHCLIERSWPPAHILQEGFRREIRFELLRCVHRAGLLERGMEEQWGQLQTPTRRAATVRGVLVALDTRAVFAAT